MFTLFSWLQSPGGLEASGCMGGRAGGWAWRVCSRPCPAGRGRGGQHPTGQGCALSPYQINAPSIARFDAIGNCAPGVSGEKTGKSPPVRGEDGRAWEKGKKCAGKCADTHQTDGCPHCTERMAQSAGGFGSKGAYWGLEDLMKSRYLALRALASSEAISSRVAASLR